MEAVLEKPKNKKKKEKSKDRQGGKAEAKPCDFNPEETAKDKLEPEEPSKSDCIVTEINEEGKSETNEDSDKSSTSEVIVIDSLESSLTIIDKENDLVSQIELCESHVAAQVLPTESINLNSAEVNKHGEAAITIPENKTDAPDVKDNKAKHSTGTKPQNTKKFENFLNLNKELANTIKKDQNDEKFLNAEKFVAMSISSKGEPSFKTDTKIKPYTEAQLSALYCNSELDLLEQFTLQFIEAELRGISVKQHPLYDLLCNYLHVREKITENNIELEQLRKEYRELQGELWSCEKVTVSGRGECQDGNIVVATHQYNKATFHRAVFQSIMRILGNIHKLIYENHVLYSYSAEELRLQIELYIQTVITNFINVTQLDRSAQVTLVLHNEPIHLKPYLGEIRLCISVLFAFQRKLLNDHTFVKETREWLNRLIAVILRLANYQDHLFIISHILRCPAGVGTWASCFLQTPLDVQQLESPFANYQINHILAILTSILTPVKSREKFLEDIAQVKENCSELFVVVDSEGEEDDEPSGTSLKENDLVALLNQLPLDDLFRAMLLVDRKNFKDTYDATKVTEHHILRFFAFSTVVLKILHRGLQTYNSPRYNQFSKRLCRFIRHVVQYASDQWEYFQTENHLEDTAMTERLQVEYDAFFLRAIYYLYSSQKLGAWQFLAVVPYNIVSIDCIWKIFYFLHDSDNAAKDILTPSDDSKFSEKIWNLSLRAQFQEKISLLEDAETYYLLNTFANMALARPESDIEFIQCATTDLLQVGFVNESTQESCSKSARILLTHITSKYPHLLSNILKEVKDNMNKIGSLALYLYEELPLAVWKLTADDMEIISRLLLKNAAKSDESKLARMILSRLNWDIDSDGKLLLPYELHCDIALLVVEAVAQDSAYTHWGWQTILRLKLHISDKGFTEFGRVLGVEAFTVIASGITVQEPLAIFAGVLMTTWGHLVPLICSKGLPQLLYLQTHHQKHEAVLFALYVIVPVFINCQECLINSEPFQQLLTNLVNADRGYISMAKSLISTQNTVLQQIGNMIETQMVNYKWYGLDSPRLLVRLWLNSLISLPNWNRDHSVMYLLDVIIRAAFFHSSALEAVQSILKELIQCGTPQEHTGTISSLFKWVSSTNSTGSLISGSLSSCTWLAYIIIDLEFEERERQTGLWKELLNQLNKQKGKVNVDAAIKKAASVVKVGPFSSGFLSIYRFAQQALDTPVDHPLLPLLWQKFFHLYLTRIPLATSVDKGCVGDKFFDGLVNFAFLKKIKRHFQDVIESYQKKLDAGSEELPESRLMFYKQSIGLFQAYALWLEEPRLQESNLHLPSLPPQYEPHLLAFIIQDSSTPWYEYLDYDRVKEEQEACVRTWRISNFRERKNINKPLLNPGSRAESAHPVERMLKRLLSYDAPKAPPSINNTAPIIPIIDFSSKDTMFKSLEQALKTLKQFAHNQMLRVSEHKALDCLYQELVPQLYRSVLHKVKRRIPCKGKNQTILCSGPAVIVLEMQDARVNERIDHQIQTNRNAYESLVTKTLQLPALSLCTASVTIQQAIKILQAQLPCNPVSAELGVELFYHILSLINEETSAYLPTKSLFASCLEKLGQSHIFGVELEMPRLLERIIKEPSLGCYLAPHFSPCNVGSVNLLYMYATITQEIGKKYDVAFALLSKFEVDNWLRQKQPKAAQRSTFIDHLMKALISLGFEPCVDSLMLHCLYRKHLLLVFEYQFPEHYGEILIHLLQASNGSNDSCHLALSVWLDIANSLARPVQIHLKVPLRDQLRQYAQHQIMLNHQELLDTAELLAKHFTTERLQYGLYGLYPKCRNYIDIFTLLLGMTGHAFIISSLNTHQGILGDKMCEKIWPHLREMFAPWLVPYSMQNVRENMASWIQQLADDRSVLLPWIPADTAYAQKIIGIFLECIQFIIQVLPACGNILSFIWQWYVNSYAHTSVKEHILNPLHHSLVLLPWNNFWPTISDLELMLRVVDQYLPECHFFLGYIFMQTPWSNWLRNFDNSPVQIKCRVYQCFLSLLVKLSNEPTVRSKHSDKAKGLLVQAECFDWEVLDASVYQHVTDWYVLSCDPFVIFKTDPLDLDFRVLHFLRAVSGYDKPQATPSPNVLKKRSMFLKSHVKLISLFANKHKTSVASKEYELTAVISFQLNHLESVVQTRDEFAVLIIELLYLHNVNSISNVALQCFNKWISKKSGDGISLKVLLQTVSNAVSDHEIVAELYETVLTSYFQNNVGENFEPAWKEIGDTLKISSYKQTELEQCLLTKGKLLTLTAILVQRTAKGSDNEILLNMCLEWLASVKINEQIEAKVPLLWLGVLYLSYKHCDIDQTCVGSILYNFVQILLEISDDRRGSNSWGRGLLNAIGLSKQGSVSMNFRFLSRAVACYVLAQLPVMKGEPQNVRYVPNAPARVGQPGGNTECQKVLLKLDFGQSQGKIKDCAELALNQIQDSNNSLHNAREFVMLLVKQFYIKPYLKDIM